MIYDYNLKLQDTRRKNDVLMQEKNIAVSNHEHDTQQLLLKMLEHLRETKVLRQKMDKIQAEKDKGTRGVLKSAANSKGHEATVAKTPVAQPPPFSGGKENDDV